VGGERGGGGWSPKIARLSSVKTGKRIRLDCERENKGRKPDWRNTKKKTAKKRDGTGTQKGKPTAYESRPIGGIDHRLSPIVRGSSIKGRDKIISTRNVKREKRQAKIRKTEQRNIQ